MAKNKSISARISDAEPKNSSGNYERLFGDKEIETGILSLISCQTVLL